jgi:hypothetical protein
MLMDVNGRLTFFKAPEKKNIKKNTLKKRYLTFGPGPPQLKG